MKKTNIIYWILTGLFAFLMLGSAIPDIFSADEAVKGMHEGLGYPVYFIPFIGSAKFLGVVAILTPGFHRLKEWAYAGLFFDLIGATYSLIAIGKADWMFMVLLLALATASYVFYQKRRRLQKNRSFVSGEGIIRTAA
ncbi:MAG: DoxX family protein [Flavisolibacter sp.]